MRRLKFANVGVVEFTEAWRLHCEDFIRLIQTLTDYDVEIRQATPLGYRRLCSAKGYQKCFSVWRLRPLCTPEILCDSAIKSEKPRRANERNVI